MYRVHAIDGLKHEKNVTGGVLTVEERYLVRGFDERRILDGARRKYTKKPNVLYEILSS